MNNEQNNGIFNIPNQNPVESDNSGFNVFNNSSNVAQSGVVSSNDGIVPVQPIPGVVENVSSNNSMDGSNNNLSSSANTETIAPVAGVNQNANVEASSPFDIGLGSTNNEVSSQSVSTAMPIDNNINNIVANEQNGVVNNAAIPAFGLNAVNNEVKQPENLEVNNNGGSNLNNSNNKNSNVNDVGTDNIVSVGKYLGHILLFSIPLVGIIMLFVKAFGDKKDKNISNFAKAQLILCAIGVVVAIIFMIISFATVGSMINNINDNANSYIDYNDYNDYTYDY